MFILTLTHLKVPNLINNYEPAMDKMDNAF